MSSLQVGSFCCRAIIEGLHEMNNRDPMWRISEHHSVQLQRLQKKYRYNRTRETQTFFWNFRSKMLENCP